ncbi:MAG: type II toxin-antitoxin system VapC family toxin [Vicinamibacterales bacterium]|jgi:predicted nucleic acid-binding protein|nr:type II toxin-antitoxin system VapC family toxin [Vicinamibacterales bacterium]
MTVYAESSAVLAWLLGEDPGDAVRGVLGSAEAVITSDLTLVECDRVLIRATALGELPEAEAADRRACLAAAAAHWQVLRLGADVVDRARRPFPGEPIRTLDAVHLASALLARSVSAGLDLLSLDRRIRSSGKNMGFRLQPE